MEFAEETKAESLESKHPEQEDKLGFNGSDHHSVLDKFRNLSVQQNECEEGEEEGAEKQEVDEIKHDHHSNDMSYNSINRGDGKGDREMEEAYDDNGDKEESEDEKRGKENDNVDENGNEKEEAAHGDVEKSSRSQYPVRPEAEDCSFYLRTGTCKFGMNCKFNHPVKLNNKDDNVKEKDGSLGKTGQPNCKYYERAGGCKYGSACRYNHCKKTSTTPPLELNFMGLPIRPGEKECPYYMRNGSCKYAANCRFHHLEPSARGGSDAFSGYTNGTSIPAESASPSSLTPWSTLAALNDSTSYMPLMFPPTQGVPSSPEWNAYGPPAFAPERSIHLPSVYGANSSAKTTIYTRQQQQHMLLDEFPERPGQPECSYFLKTGDCKYRSSCKFSHPRSRAASSPPFAFSELGLPLRPGQSICSHYSRYGICKFGPVCKYDHPVNYASSVPLHVSEPDQSSSFRSTMANEALLVGSGNGS